MGMRTVLVDEATSFSEDLKQARVLASARGIACVEVDLEVLRGEREPDLKLFAA